MITSGNHVPHDLTHPQAMPLTPVPPHWVEELLESCELGKARNGGVDVRTLGPVAHATTRIRDAVDLDAAVLREEVASAYRAVIESLEKIGRHPARFWNFIPDIGERIVDGLDRYMVFNAGRHDAYSDQCGALGTASAVGITGADLFIHCLALDAPGTPIENPRQTPAWQYSARYGPLPPCFSRAVIVELAGRRTLLIGGTASVVGEDSRHAGQFDEQLEETLLNLEALIRTADRNSPDGSTALHRLVDLRAYVTSPAEAERVREVLASRCPRARNVAVALAQVCRPELLVEIEGIAEL
jgi:chorismate lyase / 3-hydroxybenzoate synthase